MASIDVTTPLTTPGRTPEEPPDAGTRRPGFREDPPTGNDLFALTRLGLADRWTMLGLLVMSAVLSLWNLNGAPGYQDDEGTYAAQAFAVQDGQLAPYTYWYDHPPLGWIQIAGLSWIPELLQLGDGTAVGATRYVISVFFVASAILLYMLARRLRVRIPFAALATVVFVLSPLSLVLGRQVYLDNVGVPWLLASIYFALSTKHALRDHVLAGVCFAIAVLSKETLAIFGPALLVALVNRPRWSNRSFSIAGFLAIGALILSMYPLAALLRNELVSGPDHVSLQDALAYQFLERSGSGTIFDEGSKRAELLEGWMYFDKYLIAAGLIAAVVCLARRNTQFIALAVVVFVLPIVFGEGWLPAMYILAVIPFLALALAVAVDILWAGVKRLGYSNRHLRIPLRAGFVAVLGLGLITMSMPQWFQQDRELLTADNNEDWRNTLAWAQDNLSRDDIVLTPYSMWYDLNASGWNDPWKVIAVEKPDLDAQFAEEVPGGWQDVDYIIVGPIVRDNIEALGLTQAGQVLENSVPVETFGGWSINRVNPSIQTAEGN